MSAVHVVSWLNEPQPRERWSGDRFWPHVEVYESWGDGLKRWGELRDLGYPAMLDNNVQPIPVGVQPEPVGHAYVDGPYPGCMKCGNHRNAHPAPVVGEREEKP